MAGMRSCGPCDCETRQDSGREQPDQASGPSTHSLPAQCGTHPHSRLWQTQRACCLGVRDSTQRGCQAFEQVIAVEFIWLPGAGEAGLSAGACDQPRAHSSGPCPPTCVLCCRRGFCSAQSLRGWWPATRHLGATGRRVDEFAGDQAPKSRRGGGTTPLPDASWRPGWPSQRHGQHQRHRPSTRSGVSCLPIAAVDRLPWTGLSGLPRTAGMKRTNRGRRGGSAREGGRRSQLEAFAGVGGVSGGAQVGRANDRPGDRCKGSVARPPSSAIRWDLLCCLAETRADNWDEVVSTPLTERRLR